MSDDKEQANDSPELLKEANRIKNEALDQFVSKADRKYDAGQREHGGLITDRVNLGDLEDEIIDLWFYLQALKVKLHRTVLSIEPEANPESDEAQDYASAYPQPKVTSTGERS